MTPTDPELILRCLEQDDTAAFGELVRRHQSAVRGFLRQLTRGDAAWSDDLAQETFIRAYRGLERYGGRSRFGTWLLGIAYNQFRNGRRRIDRAPSAGDPSERLAAPAAGTLADLKQDLSSALALLPHDEHLALNLSLHFALFHEDIAATTGWPLGTVKTHIARGKERLRGLLSEWNPKT